MKNLAIMCLLIGCVSDFAWGQDIWMHPNAGQWDDRILYKIDLNEGDMYIEKDGFTFYLHNGKQLLSHGDHDHDHSGVEVGSYLDEHDHEEDSMFVHNIQSKFIGSNWQGKTELIDSSYFYRNYFIGNDQSKWKSELYSYNHLRLKDFYSGIDLDLKGKQGRLKYSLIVEPGVDANQIVFKYSGQYGIKIDEDGNLRIQNRFGEIIENKPVAWVEGEYGKRNIEVRFELDGETVKFVFPNGYDNSQKLVIDPDLTFSSFSGSTADNWGFTAAPDVAGNLFGGGVVFGTGYPILSGAYDGTYNGGTIDLGITKFNADGTNLLYSTYIGGSGSETPNSIVSAPSGDLFIFGITSSGDFPMAGTPFDNTYNGGPSIPNNQTNNLGFTGGSDLYVARLSANGSNLIASTYVGGSGTDGLNTSTLMYNYGDQFRGDIVLDGNNNVYVASHTLSPDFPTVGGSQPVLSGAQDAVVFKLNSNLSNLLWSRFLGGSGEDTGNSLQLSSTGDVYVAGGTASFNLNFPTGFDLSFDGGISDGYLARLNGNTGATIGGTYMGLNEYDQAYFVQCDIDDRVYVLGQTESAWTITSGCYGNPNSGQFIRKYSTDLMTVDWTTMIGAGTGNVEISPTAFLISDCYDIYLSGWGGYLNTIAGSQAVNSTSNGFPVTLTPPNVAFQATTNGSNFYIAVLDQDATSLKYGTYMGGVVSSNNHVDGGTSRFDKSGRIYHAVCGSCGAATNGFTTTPGVWAESNPSTNCNLAAFKFELSTIEAVISNPTPLVCLPDPVIFNNNSANGNAFFWNFGDGFTSTDVNPVHFYAGPGSYTVTLVVSDTNGCFTPDSTEFVVEIGDFQGGVIQPPGPICPGESFQFEAYGGSNYEWSPAQYLDNPNVFNPTATIDQTTTFQVIISDTCGIDTVNVTLEVFLGNVTASNDTSICIGNNVNLFATGGVDYVWSPPTYLDDPTSPNPISEPSNSISYTVTVTTSNNCILTETVDIDVYFTPPVPIIPDSVSLCQGSSLDVSVSGADTYAWDFHPTISPIVGPDVTISPLSDMYYYCDFVNACGTVRDSVFASIIEPSITAGNDTIICPGQVATMWAQGGLTYFWTPYSSIINTPNTSQVLAVPSTPTMYYVTGTDEFGCTATDSVFVDLFPLAFIQTVPDVYAFLGDNVQLGATSSTPGNYVWSPTEYLSCVVCTDPIANPDQNYTYTVTYTDINGCVSADTVNIFYDPILYVPNSFTPGDDPLNVNDVFFAQGGNIAGFRMEIFNRWGELIRTLESLSDVWDGRYKGVPCQDGTYTWKATITDLQGEESVHVGHVNLLR